MLNLDTHILLYALTDELTPRERKLLRQHEWAVSAIVLWEVAKLATLGRLEVEFDSVEFGRLMGQLQILPLTLQICRASTRLDFSSDPADELIAATSIVHRLPLVTRDRRIRASRLVPFARV